MPKNVSRNVQTPARLGRGLNTGGSEQPFLFSLINKKIYDILKKMTFITHFQFLMQHWIKQRKKKKRKKFKKSAPAGIRTHDPLAQPNLAKWSIYSTIISSLDLLSFGSHSQVRRGIDKALYVQNPHYRGAFRAPNALSIPLRTQKFYYISRG